MMNLQILGTNLVVLIILVNILLVSSAFNEGVHYKYSYSIEEPILGVITHHWEQRKGNYVQGGYSLLDADGRIRVVDYHVDGAKGGFKSHVKFRKAPVALVGHLKYPTKQYRTPVRLAEPVSLITPDLFIVKADPHRKYPNLP